MEITQGFSESADEKRHFILLITDIKESNFTKISNFEYHLLVKNKGMKVLAIFSGEFAYFIKSQLNTGQENEYKQGNTVLTRLSDGNYRLYLRVNVDKKCSFKLNRPSFSAEVMFSNYRPIHKKKQNNNSTTHSKGQNTKMLNKSYAAYEKKVRSGQFKVPYIGNISKEKQKKGIRLAKSESRMCTKCTNLIGSKCVVHQMNVNRDDSCRHFHPYKVQLGGGFSPR